MDILELRINSTVWYNDKRVKITAIDNTDDVPFVKTSFRDDKWLHAKLIDPIPVTPELVKELGFFESEMVKDTPILTGIYVDPYMFKLAKESKGDFSKMPTDDLFQLWHVKLPNKYGEWKIFANKGEIYVSYLHELENMYHYLTGREL